MKGKKPIWRVRVNAKIRRPVPVTARAGAVAAMFGLPAVSEEVFYDRLSIELRPGELLAVVGPSGAGKSLLLSRVSARWPGAVQLWADGLAGESRAAVDALPAGGLRERLELLSRCGLAEAPALVTPADRLSGGQRHRLALAMALSAARSAGKPALVIADEFAATLDTETAHTLCRQVRKLIDGSPCALLLATPRAELLADLRPDGVVVKPLGVPGTLVRPRPAGSRRGGDPRRWPIRRGNIADYRELGRFHYLAGPPAAHKRVWVVRPPRGRLLPGGPQIAAVLVVSPPVLNVRGRNLATGGRYVGGDRRAAANLLNREIECISRVVVHPVYRGCGLAVRLVRHAIRTADTPMVESLAAMGAVHPLFEAAGMRAWHVGPDKFSQRLIDAATAAGLSRADLAAAEPVRRAIRRRGRRSRALADELRRCIARTLDAPRRARSADPLAEVCRRAVRNYVYYLAGSPAHSVAGQAGRD